MSEGNLHRCVRTNKIQAQDLERIATALEVSIDVFFNAPNIISQDPKYSKPVDIHAIIEEKDARIKDLKECIDLLVKHLAKLSDGFVNH